MFEKYKVYSEMFNKKQVKQMIALSEELEEAMNAKPYDAMRYERVLKKIDRTHSCLYNRGRYYDRLFFWVIFVNLLILSYIVYLILR